MGWEAKPSCLRVAQSRCQHIPVSGFCKRFERRQFILMRASTPKALRRPVAPLCHPSTPPCFIHKPFLPNTNKRTLLSRIFIKSWGCGWLMLPSETNHLIKKKWADRINGPLPMWWYASLETATAACKQGCNRPADRGKLMDSLKHPKFALHTSWWRRKSLLEVSTVTTGRYC